MAAIPSTADGPGDGDPAAQLLIAAPPPDEPLAASIQAPEPEPVPPAPPAPDWVSPPVPVERPGAALVAPVGVPVGVPRSDSAAIPRTGRSAPQHRAARPASPRPQARGNRRLQDPIGSGRRVRSGVELLVMTVVLGILLATVLAIAIGAIVVALQHALNG